MARSLAGAGVATATTLNVRDPMLRSARATYDPGYNPMDINRDGVVSDDRCGLYLPSHGHEIPLHLNLPHEHTAERAADPSIRRVGGGGGSSASALDEGEDVCVLSLAQQPQGGAGGWPSPGRTRRGRPSGEPSSTSSAPPRASAASPTSRRCSPP